jgi:uncharacterized protein YcbK (DUF882 family)
VAGQQVLRLIFAALMAIAVLLPPTSLPVNAENGDRTLYLYHTHTHETARITFKRDGVYDKKGLEELDWFLRDWRNNHATTMSPELFDLLWEIYQEAGATQPINIVSSYRSPQTNAYLRARSKGVANDSQHMLGHAMDIFIPGVPLEKLRAIAMRQQVGGVGYYPTSASPFVHVDVGTVRAWPRMTEAQLRTLFPRGRTLHMPTDGVVLSASGRAWAQAQWDRCHAVPCTNAAALTGGAASRGKDSMVAVAETSMTGKTFADIHAGINPGNPRIRGPGDYDDADDDATGPARMAVESVAMIAPVPMPRPAGLEPVSTDASVDAGPATLAAAARGPFDSLFPDAYAPGIGPTTAGAAGEAPLPARKSYQMMVATGETPGAGRLDNAVTAIAAAVPMPHEPRAAPAPAERGTVTAYAPVGRGTKAEDQLEAIISGETTGTIAMAPTGGTALTNSMGSPIGAAALRQYAAARRTHQGTPPVLAASRSFTARTARLIAPGFDVALESPVTLTSGRFARFVEPEAMDLSPATELGPMVVRVGFRPDGPAPDSAHFAPGSSLLVAAR